MGSRAGGEWFCKARRARAFAGGLPKPGSQTCLTYIACCSGLEGQAGGAGVCPAGGRGVGDGEAERARAGRQAGGRRGRAFPVTPHPPALSSRVFSSWMPPMLTHIPGHRHPGWRAAGRPAPCWGRDEEQKREREVRLRAREREVARPHSSSQSTLVPLVLLLCSHFSLTNMTGETKMIYRNLGRTGIKVSETRDGFIGGRRERNETHLTRRRLTGAAPRFLQPGSSLDNSQTHSAPRHCRPHSRARPPSVG